MCSDAIALADAVRAEAYRYPSTLTKTVSQLSTPTKMVWAEACAIALADMVRAEVYR